MNNYIRQIVRQLKCSKVKKEEIRKQLTADYQELILSRPLLSANAL